MVGMFPRSLNIEFYSEVSLVVAPVLKPDDMDSIATLWLLMVAYPLYKLFLSLSNLILCDIILSRTADYQGHQSAQVRESTCSPH